MVFIRKKSIAGENTESPPRTHPSSNIRKLRTPSRTVFTQKYNELFIEKFLQCSQDVAGDELHFFVLGLNESSTEEYMKKYYCSLARRFHSNKNQHLNCTDLMQVIKQDKEELGYTFRNNNAMREHKHVRMDATREEECVRMAQYDIIISSDDKSD